MALNTEQIDLFHESGYLSVGKVLQDAEIEVLREEYDRMLELYWRENKLRNLAISDTEDLDAKKNAPLKMIQMMQLSERSLIFRKLLYDARLLDMVQDFIGPNIMLFHDQALYKPKHDGGAVFWHQDNSYWKCRPANLVSLWLTLDDADEQNGALHFIPGSHLKPVHHVKAESTNALLDIHGVDVAKAKIVELPAGGCLLHHCQTLHYSPPNRTSRQRRAFIMHYMNPGTRMGDGYLEVAFERPLLRGRY